MNSFISTIILIILISYIGKIESPKEYSVSYKSVYHKIIDTANQKPRAIVEIGFPEIQMDL